MKGFYSVIATRGAERMEFKSRNECRKQLKHDIGTIDLCIKDKRPTQDGWNISIGDKITIMLEGDVAVAQRGNESYYYDDINFMADDMDCPAIELKKQLISGGVLPNGFKVFTMMDDYRYR